MTAEEALQFGIVDKIVQRRGKKGELEGISSKEVKGDKR